MLKNAIGREIPERIEGLGELTPYQGPFAIRPKNRRRGPQLRQVEPGEKKLLPNLEKALIETGAHDGMTISFHHHFREGDYLLEKVIDAAARIGLKNLVIAPSSLTNVHSSLIEHIKNGVIKRIETSGLRGSLGEFISKGMMDTPVIIRSHGGRARAIEAGETKIDIAFLSVSSCDNYGNASGCVGRNVCGALGYAMVDAKYAEKVVLVTDTLVDYPNVPASIDQTDVDHIVVIDAIGDSGGIMSGPLRHTSSPRDLLIAEYTAKVVEYSGYFKDGFSIQSGSGGASLAVARFLRDKMLEKNITASFMMGGISAQHTVMLKEGLVRKLYDTQTFDLEAVKSLAENPNHVEISAAYYANPHSKGAVVNCLDVGILSALEIDTDFNVNVITGSDGIIRGASGGHSDIAAGAKLKIVIAPLVRKRMPIVVDRVNTVTTPGETIDVLVTDWGIAVNQKQPELMAVLGKTGLPLYDIKELQEKAESITGRPDLIKYTDRIVGIVEYRDGSIIDVIRQVM